MTIHDRTRMLKRKLVIFGTTALAVAAIGSVAITPGAPRDVAAATEPSDAGGPLVRSNGVTTGQYATVVSTYVVVGPGGVLYGPDGSPIPQDPLATLGAVGFPSGTPGAGKPQAMINTPTPVAYQGQPDTSGSAPIGAPPAQTHIIGPLDGPAPAYALPVPTATSQYIITGQGSGGQANTGSASAAPASTGTGSTSQASTGQVSVQPTIDPANNPNVLIGTPSGGVNSMGVVQGNTRGK